MKPILFSTEMVQAILDGKKTQTRRAIKPQPYLQDGLCWESKNRQLLGWHNKKEFSERLLGSAPYQIGDILWVKETWKCIGLYGDYGYEVKFLDDTKIKFEFADEERVHKWIKYYDKNGWQSPYFMPKEAARIFLRVTNARAERLQEITEADAIAEGITLDEALEAGSEHFLPTFNNPDNSNPFPDYKGAYQCLWNSLNAKRGYSWESNPWVWVIEFERIEKLEGAET